MNAATPRRGRIQIGRTTRTIPGTLLSRPRANHRVQERRSIRRDLRRDCWLARREKMREREGDASFSRLHLCGYAANSKMILPLRWPRAAWATAVFASLNG